MITRVRTNVCIIGGGPSGLLLSQLLHRAGIDSIVLERKTRDYVLGRIRAGVLEFGTVELLQEAGVGDRMGREGYVHDGCYIALKNRGFRIDFQDLINKRVMVYGQTEVTQDLYNARDAMGGVVIEEAAGAMPHDVDSEAPYVTYTKGGVEHRVDCDFVAGCDGFHGVSRTAIPEAKLKEFERVYPFGWLGVLSETKPASHELIYSNHPRGFALCSMRNANLSRYYIQVGTDDSPDNWSDQRFWDELRRRIPEEAAETMETGPSIEKSIAPLRAFVAEPMSWGRLFLCGDAAHIVPPTGAKGLNLAMSDVNYLYRALRQHYDERDSHGLDTYSQTALARVWKAMQFTWKYTNLLHHFPGQSDFDQRMQEIELTNLEQNRAARVALAEKYVGLPY